MYAVIEHKFGETMIVGEWLNEQSAKIDQQVWEEANPSLYYTVEYFNYR